MAHSNSTSAVPKASFVHLWRSLRFSGFPEAKTTVIIMPGYYGTFFIGWTFTLVVQKQQWEEFWKSREWYLAVLFVCYFVIQHHTLIVKTKNKNKNQKMSVSLKMPLKRQ